MSAHGTPAEIAWLKKRCDRPLPTRGNSRNVGPLYDRGLLSLVWIRGRLHTYATPLGRAAVREHNRARRAVRIAGVLSATQPRSRPARTKTDLGAMAA